VWSGDGLDQAKSEMPHLQRQSHNTEEYKGAIPVHVVSAFVFGGPIPILGFINLADIVKNSSLTVVNMHRSITMQFDVLLEKEKERIEELKRSNPRLSDEECRLKLPTWPRRLHICFDNAGGENINSNVYFYLSVLVHMGVFEYITISTLFVGHTHNINDQLFSVWSKWLDHNDCLSLEMMMSSFENNYKAFMQKEIQETTVAEQSKQQIVDSAAGTASNEEKQDSPAATAAPVSNESLHVINTDAIDDMSDEESNELVATKDKYKKSQKDSVNKLYNVIEKCGELSKPKMEKVPCNLHINGWIPEEVRSRIQNNRTNPFSNIQKYHVFAIGKEEDGNTYLFKKFTVNSEILYKSTHPHEHTFQGTSYRKKDMVLKKGETIAKDPLRMPFNYVDTTKAKGIIQEFQKANLFAKYPGAKEQLESTIKTLEDQVIQQRNICETCDKLMRAVSDIGVVKKPGAGSSEEVVQAYREQSNRKRKAQEEYQKHLSEPSDETHSALIMNGWWTDWVNKRIPLITEHFKDRGIFRDLEAAAEASGESGLAQHPEDYSREEAHEYLRAADACYQQIGPPKVGHFVVIRAEREEGKPPFWLATIRAYRNMNRQDQELESSVKEIALQRQVKSGAPIPPWPANASGFIEEEAGQGVNSSRSSELQGMKGSRSKDRMASHFNIFSATHILVDWYNHIEKVVRKPAAKRGGSKMFSKRQKKTRKQSDNSGSSVAQSDDDESMADQRSESASIAPASIRNNTLDAILEVDEDTPLNQLVSAEPRNESSHSVDMTDVEGLASETICSSAAAASSSAMQSDSGAAAPLQSQTITAANDTTAQLRDAQRENSSLSHGSPSEENIPGEFIPLHESELNLFRHNRYVQLHDEANFECNRWMQVADIICWGPKDKMLTHNMTLKDGMWKLIVQDLTQITK
jgi:hypothetical protein